ncbi:MAG: hypothetical protein QOF38_787, partial [Pseudonocardiales bacterium]|nr:hypothetical protein [Pseudonocardiales bacterium]
TAFLLTTAAAAAGLVLALGTSRRAEPPSRTG